MIPKFTVFAAFGIGSNALEGRLSIMEERALSAEG